MFQCHGGLGKKDVFEGYDVPTHFKKYMKALAKCNLNMKTFILEVMAGTNGFDGVLDSGTESISQIGLNQGRYLRARLTV